MSAFWLGVTMIIYSLGSMLAEALYGRISFSVHGFSLNTSTVLYYCSKVFLQRTALVSAAACLWVRRARSQTTPIGAAKILRAVVTQLTTGNMPPF